MWDRNELGLAAVAAGGFGLDELQSRPYLGRPSIGEFRYVSRFRYCEAGVRPFFGETTFRARRRQIDLYNVSQTGLPGGDQIRKRIDEMPFDCALEVPRTVLQIRAFAEQESLGF